MNAIIRPFARSDREQLTDLVNRHVHAVVPGLSLSVNAVMSQLEREPLDAIIDPWVADRTCLVAEADGRVVAAALLHRFADDERVRVGYRNAAEIRYLLCEPGRVEAGIALANAALDRFEAWGAAEWLADGSLPAPGCVGVPDAWPHVLEVYTAAEFEGPMRQDVVHVADCEQLAKYRIPGMPVERSVGPLGTILRLRQGPDVVGSIEVCQTALGVIRADGADRWADVGNLDLVDGHSPRLIGPALYGAAAHWLLRGGVRNLIDYRADDVPVVVGAGLLGQIGFEVLSRNGRGWRRPNAQASSP